MSAKGSLEPIFSGFLRVPRVFVVGAYLCCSDLAATLEKLDCALMFLGLLTSVERAQIAALAGLRVFPARVEPVLA